MAGLRGTGYHALVADLHAPYLEVWKRRFAEAAERRREAVKEARTTAQRCALLLAERFGARRVWLFGSLLREDRFDPGFSDIDLAVEGLRGDFWAAITAVSALACPIRVELKEIEGSSPELREVIQSEGELLHDAGP